MGSSPSRFGTASEVRALSETRGGHRAVDWGCRRTRRRAEPGDTARPTEGQHNRQEPGGRLDSRASPCRGKAPAQGGPRVMVGARGGVGGAGNNRPSGPRSRLQGPGGRPTRGSLAAAHYDRDLGRGRARARGVNVIASRRRRHIAGHRRGFRKGHRGQSARRAHPR